MSDFDLFKRTIALYYNKEDEVIMYSPYTYGFGSNIMILSIIQNSTKKLTFFTRDENLEVLYNHWYKPNENLNFYYSNDYFDTRYWDSLGFDYTDLTTVRNDKRINYFKNLEQTNTVLFNDFCKIFSSYPVNKNVYYIDNHKLQNVNLIFGISFSTYANQFLTEKNFEEKYLTFPFWKMEKVEKMMDLISFLKVNHNIEFIFLDNIHSDNFYNTLVQKSTVMSLCNCIISYEGGINHLASVLGIPSIIINGYQGKAKFDRFVYQLGDKNYFINSLDELYKDDTNFYWDLIKNLNLGKNNNFFLNQETKYCVFDNTQKERFVLAAKVPLDIIDPMLRTNVASPGINDISRYNNYLFFHTYVDHMAGIYWDALGDVNTLKVAGKIPVERHEDKILLDWLYEKH